jgi:hypothetical protein
MILALLWELFSAGISEASVKKYFYSYSHSNDTAYSVKLRPSYLSRKC